MGYSRLSCLDNFRFQWPSPVVFKGFCRFSCFKTLSIFHATRESSSKISRNRKKDKIPWIWKISRNRKIDKIPFEFEKCFGPQVPVKHVNHGFGPGVPVIHMNSFHFTCGNLTLLTIHLGPAGQRLPRAELKQILNKLGNFNKIKMIENSIEIKNTCPKLSSANLSLEKELKVSFICLKFWVL